MYCSSTFVTIVSTPDLANNILVDEARPQCQLLLLKLEEVSAFCVCRDHWVDEFGLVNATAVKVVVVCNDPHLVLAEYEREIPVLPPPRRLREEAREI